MKEIKENNRVTCALYLNARTEYLIEFSKFKNKRTIEQNDIQKDPLSKQFIEMIIKDILYSNPKLEFYKDVFVMTNRRKTIETNNVSISFSDNGTDYVGFESELSEDTVMVPMIGEVKGVEENPKTGLFNYLLLIIPVVLLGIGFNLLRRVNIFKKI
jgi:hypothetical protein